MESEGRRINVIRNVTDEFYRYKMPVLRTKVEGGGNGIKTIIPNMDDVAKAIDRQADWVTKYMGTVVGARADLDTKGNKWTINGKHDQPRLLDVLFDFIDAFVVCGPCHSPETKLIINKKQGTITRQCKACGEYTPVDIRIKVCGYIIKTAPDEKKPTRSATKETDDAGSDPAEDDDALAQRLKAEAAELPPVEASALATDEWTAGANDIADRVDELELNDDDKPEEDPFQVLSFWIETSRDNPPSIDQVRTKILELGIRERHKTIQVLAESLFTHELFEKKQIDTYYPIFQELMENVEKKDKHQRAFLGGLERLVGVNYRRFLNDVDVGKILLAFYVADVLEEDAIRYWATHQNDKYVDKKTSRAVRLASRPFLKALEEAPSESEEEE